MTTTPAKPAPRCPICRRCALETRGQSLLCVPALGGCGTMFTGA